MTEAVIVDAVRTPIGRFAGALSGLRPDDLGAVPLRALIERTGIDGAEVEDVVFGCANQAGEDNRNVARMSLLLAGLPHTVAGSTVNRLCGSGLEAVSAAARSIMLGEADVYVAGGVESMSRAPWVTLKPDRGFPRGVPQTADTAIGWRFVNPSMEELRHTDSLGVTAENVAEEYDVDRAAQDRFALRSHERAVGAAREGRFDAELVPVETRDGVVDRDEGPRADTSLEKLARLRPAFREGGTVTAGNSSSLNDGAAAVMLVSADFARAHGLKPLARIRAMAVAGVEPRLMGMGPVPATAKALARSGLAIGDVDLIELNEAFASQSLAVLGAWGIEAENDIVNVNGGAIALGHPLGCSGARLLATLVHELGRRDGQIGVATMCIGVGQGIAVVVDREL